MASVVADRHRSPPQPRAPKPWPAVSVALLRMQHDSALRLRVYLLSMPVSPAPMRSTDDAVAQLSKELSDGASAGMMWSVVGEPTSGTSSVLDQLHEQLSADGRTRSVLVRPPAHQYDSGPAALIDLVSGLGLSDSALDVIQDPGRSWAEKLDRAHNALAREGSFVLLLDAPDSWRPEETYFSRFVDDVLDLVISDSQNRVVTAGEAPFFIRGARKLRLEPRGDPDAVLSALAAPTLMGAKGAVVARFDKRLTGLSPLQIRLLVAIAALDPDSLALIDPERGESCAAPALVQVLANLVGSSSPELARVWAHLAMVRCAFADDLLGLVGVEALAPQERVIVRDCLLFARGEGLFMHESLREGAKLIDYDPTEVHARLAKYYRHRFDDPEAGGKRRLRDSVEAFHHASSAGIDALDEYRPFFTDQLNILGYHLSYDLKEPARAADTFNVALCWDPHNAYAAHYRAFNLELQVAATGAKVDISEVERLYRLAVDEMPTHPWFHARLVNFLIAESRMRDAWDAWLQALDKIGPDPRDAVYFGLHLHVARNFLYRGEFDRVETILRSLPATVLEDERFLAIKDRLWALRETDRRGSYLPAAYLRPRWWSAPKLIVTRGLRRWLAAKVVGARDGVLDLDVADIIPGGEPSYGSLAVSEQQLASSWHGRGAADSLASGDFIEIGFYDDESTVTMQHPAMIWPDRTAPNEDPDRYLRAAAE